ncbi:nucleoside deaminase [Methylophaga sp.]|jgi:tRNA(Arg) A34 adenosine deaminase TadA|uniref:nucleoside deaminase n=1 Tax=Methylophaga sp. TaxID=2024840 RepID=UPI0013FEB211|nr:nucleoside deaminase [Methylophaga sp.]MTI62906.1 nucleoside deaminase [Methylophaga sp.]
METLIQFELPKWLLRYQQSYQTTTDYKAQMDFLIDVSRLNIQYDSGGPFAAGVFEIDTGRLVALGVNMVTSENLSILHAEMVALSLAQQARGNYDLGAAKPDLSLVTTCEPCAMCFGAIPWSGVRQVVAGATDADARNIGFDEGPKPEDWQKALEDRNIRVISGVHRDKAAAVLSAYVKQGGMLYNARQG